ncbi:unnamed protein product [Fraxinus pennsylvanica]|uniref:UDP-glucuronate decarboxylase n=1 Tax=Fraxinus pennsylvanica TaxID=56036 RepID=A0AAD1ZNF8_9LAMI|nr:unnamed protein product [Fraxinus pennsylvanica]
MGTDQLLKRSSIEKHQKRISVTYPFYYVLQVVSNNTEKHGVAISCMVFTVIPSVLPSRYESIAESNQPIQLPRRIAYELLDGIGHHIAGVRSCYDEGKRTAETLTMDYHRGLNLEVRIARISNTYGPRMCIDDGRVVSNFVAQALRKEPLTVYGDGKQTRSFQYVSDLVEGLMRLMEGDHVGPFNLGNPGEFTMLELAQVVQETIDKNAKIKFRPNTEDDPHKRKPAISKAKTLLGWQPTVSLREGLPLI